MTANLSPSVNSKSLPRPETRGVILKGWLIKARDSMEPKWTCHYFVLHNLSKKVLALDEYRSDDMKRLKKSYLMEQCIQVDHYLQLQSYPVPGMRLQWIFAVHFSNHNSSRSELYLVAESEEEMLQWVHAICRACNLESLDRPNEKKPSRPLRIKPLPQIKHQSLLSSIRTISMSTNVSINEFSSDQLMPVNHDNEDDDETEGNMGEFLFPSSSSSRSSKKRADICCRSVNNKIQSVGQDTIPDLEIPPLQWPSKNDFTRNPKKNYAHINQFNTISHMTRSQSGVRAASLRAVNDEDKLSVADAESTSRTILSSHSSAPYHAITDVDVKVNAMENRIYTQTSNLLPWLVDRSSKPNYSFNHSDEIWSSFDLIKQPRFLRLLTSPRNIGVRLTHPASPQKRFVASRFVSHQLFVIREEPEEN